MKPKYLYFFCLCIIAFYSCKSKEKANNSAKIENFFDTTSYKRGDTIQPFKNYNFKDGNWKVVIRISPEDDHDLSENIPPVSKLTTSTKEVLDKH